MAATIVQQTSELNESAAFAYPTNNKLGNLLVVASVAANSPSSTLPVAPPTVTDTQGNIWIVIAASLVQSPLNGPLFAQSLIFAYCSSCKAGANSVTVNWGTVTHSAMCLWEISGASQLDQVAIGSGASGTSFSTSSVTTHGYSEIALAHFCTNDNNPASFASTGGWTTEPNTNAFNTDQYELLSAPSTISATCTASGSTGTWMGSMVTFSEVIIAPEDGGYIPPVGGDWDRNITVFQ